MRKKRRKKIRKILRPVLYTGGDNPDKVRGPRALGGPGRA
jgi:hypothetical protein